ncbi:MAG: NAD(P)-binding protein [Clostridiales bacterium]|nr:NAD(P)-binding protein [Clostridiales bacterium]
MEKRIRVSQIKVPLQHEREQVINKACKMAGVCSADIIKTQIVRQSVDARRNEDVKYIYSVDIVLKKGARYKKDPRHIQEVTPVTYRPQPYGHTHPDAPIAVIGSGPAGLFCAYLLAKNGYRPLIFERGKAVEDRQRDVQAFWNGGVLLPDSNVQFGEGGAGTFSDGKLNTAVKDKSGRNQFVLETFVSAGAPEDILYMSRPHIGTDVLRNVVVNMRREIIRMGGCFYFSSCVTDFQVQNGRLTGLVINGKDHIPVSAAVLAVGHSARDTFDILKNRAAAMEPKAFAVGMRIEHPQAMIDESQYGKNADRSLLPAAAYKLTHRAKNGRSVYSFCMCPGGFVVNASSEEGRLAINGMSNHARDGKNANSAIVVSVTPEDFPDPKDPLSGVAFQRELEARAWQAGQGKIPQQTFGEFEKEFHDKMNYVKSSLRFDHESEHHENNGFPDTGFSSCTGGAAVQADLRPIFPPVIREAFVDGMQAFGKKIRGFDRPDAILSAVESRTSSPVRILRDDSFQSNILGLYPCGEGAGYAGGIMSAAMDGLKVAEALMHKYCPEFKG